MRVYVCVFECVCVCLIVCLCVCVFSVCFGNNFRVSCCPLQTIKTMPLLNSIESDLFSKRFEKNQPKCNRFVFCGIVGGVFFSVGG